MNMIMMQAKNAIAWLEKRGIKILNVKSAPRSPLIEINVPCAELAVKAHAINEKSRGLSRRIYAARLEGCFVYWR